MKLAIVGKGGVGKTTLAAAMARHLATLQRSVIAVDADPDGNLAAALGVSEDDLPSPIAQMRDLVLERTEAKDEGAGLMFQLNPKVDDMIAVVEPGMRSVQTAARICRLAKDIGIVHTFVVANKIAHKHELDVLRQALDGQVIIGTLPYNAELARADLEGRPLGMEDRSWDEDVGQIVRAVQKQID